MNKVNKNIEKELKELEEKLVSEEYVLIKKNNKQLKKRFFKNIKKNGKLNSYALTKKVYNDFIIIYNKDSIDIEFHDDFFKLLRFLFDIQEKNMKLTFRGHSNANYKLISSLLREDENLKNEDEIYFDIIKAFPEKFLNARYHLDYLKTIQHYGGKTRIMDVSTNFLIALYFAVCNQEENHGEIIILNKNKDRYYADLDGPTYIKKVKRLNSDTIEILASLAALDYEKKSSIKQHTYSYIDQIRDREIEEKGLIKSFNKELAVEKLVHEVGQVRLNFDAIIEPKHLLEVYFSDSTFDNERISNQAGEFIIHGLLSKGETMNKINKFRYTRNGKKLIVLIDKNEKLNIISYLKTFNIKESTIYPSLENTIREIHSKYTKN